MRCSLGSTSSTDQPASGMFVPRLLLKSPVSPVVNPTSQEVGTQPLVGDAPGTHWTNHVWAQLQDRGHTPPGTKRATLSRGSGVPRGGPVRERNASMGDTSEQTWPHRAQGPEGPGQASVSHGTRPFQAGHLGKGRRQLRSEAESHAGVHRARAASSHSTNSVGANAHSQRRFTHARVLAHAHKQTPSQPAPSGK